MKEGIHPDYHEITVVMTDGTKYKTRSTWGKAGDTLQLDVDSKSHPAWVGGVNLRKTGQMEKFANKFGALGALGASGKAGAKAEEKKEAAPKAEAKAAAPKADKKPAEKKAKAAKKDESEA